MRGYLFTSMLLIAAPMTAAHADDLAQPGAPYNFTIYARTGGQPGQCEPSTKTTIAGEAEMYKIEGKKTLSHKDGTRKTSFPLQELFRSYGPGVISKSRSTSLANDPISCDDMVITWDVTACINQDRQTVPCPDFEVIGADGFAGFVINP